METVLKDKKAKKELSSDLTSGALLPKIISFTIPLMLTGLLQTLYNATDMIVVGYFSSSVAMGAVGACASLIGLIVNTFIGLSVGAAVCVARDFGAKKYAEVEKVVGTSFVFSGICGIIIAIFGFIFAEFFLELMGTTPNLLKEAVPYMRAYFVGVPANVMYNYLASIVRSSGDTKRPLIFLAISGVVNVVLNFVMVFFFGLGAVGVGIATAVAQYTALFLIVRHMTRLENCCKLDLKNIKVDKTKLKTIVTIGLPAGIQGSLFALSNVLIQSTVNSFGDITIQGNSASANIESFIYIAMNALHHTALTFVGQNIGAGKRERIRPIILYTTGIVTGVGIVLGLIAILAGEPLLSIYAHGDAKVVEAGVTRLTVIALTYFLCGIMDVGCGISRGLGNSVLPMIISLVGSCAFRIFWVKVVCPVYPEDIFVLYVSYPISWVMTAAAHFISCFITYKKNYSRRVPPPSTVSAS
ncbi:MAG: MATE family efflux transporter [Clostridia bacterium]|nr:MATE family efflux transporter [Clostridia bacterium]